MAFFRQKGSFFLYIYHSVKLTLWYISVFSINLLSISNYFLYKVVFTRLSPVLFFRYCTLNLYSVLSFIFIFIFCLIVHVVNVHYLKNRTGDSIKIKLFIVQCPSQKWSDKDPIASPVQALGFSCHQLLQKGVNLKGLIFDIKRKDWQ